MGEETNQNIEATSEVNDTTTTEPAGEFDNIFSDVSDDNAETEPTEDTSIDGAEQTSETTEPEVVKAVYNGKEIPIDKQAVDATAKALGITPQEYINTLQKGMNYDHIAQEKEALKNSKEFQVLDYFAKQNNMDRQQYVEYLEEQKEQVLIEQEKDQLLQKYPDTQPELLEEIAKINATNKLRDAEIKEKQQADEAQQAITRDWVELFTNYPDMKPEELPSEVSEMVNTGLTPMMAMLKYENGQLKQQITNVKVTQKNKDKAIGTVKSDAATQKVDPFLSGFLG